MLVKAGFISTVQGHNPKTTTFSETFFSHFLFTQDEIWEFEESVLFQLQLVPNFLPTHTHTHTHSGLSSSNGLDSTVVIGSTEPFPVPMSRLHSQDCNTEVI